MILHNRLINTWIDNLAPQDVDRIMEKERSMRRKRLDGRMRGELDDSGDGIRRQLLARQILEYDEEDIDLDTVEW